MKQAGFRRLIAFIGDIFISLTLGYFFLSQERVLTAFNKIDFYQSLSSLSAKHLVLSIAIFILYRFYWALLFKLSPLQYLCGLKLNGHNFIQVRISSALRVILMPVMAALYPLDKFLISRDKGGLSEIFTGSRLVVRGGFLTLLTGVAGLLASFILVLYGPLLYQSSFLFNPEVSFTPSVEKQLEKSRDFTLFRNYGSKAFKLMTFTDLDSGRFKVHPSFEIRRKHGKLIYRPVISIWDTSLGVKGELKIKKRFDLLSLIKLVQLNDPFFSLYYPRLSDSVDKLQIKDPDESLILGPVAKDELFTMISNGLLANPFNSSELFKRKVFYTFPYVLLKRNLFKLLGNGEGQKVDFVNRGTEIFIRTTLKDDFKDLFMEKFFSLNQLRPIIYQVTWPKNRWDSRINDTFAQAFYYKSKWGKQVLDEAKIWETEYLFNPLSILDFIGNKSFNREGVANFENYIRNYYFKEAKNSFEYDEKYQDMILASMQRVYVVWQMMKKKKRIPYAAVVLKSVGDIMRALEMRDRSFFDGTTND